MCEEELRAFNSVYEVFSVFLYTTSLNDRSKKNK